MFSVSYLYNYALSTYKRRYLDHLTSHTSQHTHSLLSKHHEISVYVLLSTAIRYLLIYNRHDVQYVHKALLLIPSIVNEAVKNRPKCLTRATIVRTYSHVCVTLYFTDEHFWTYDVFCRPWPAWYTVQVLWMLMVSRSFHVWRETGDLLFRNCRISSDTSRPLALSYSPLYKQWFGLCFPTKSTTVKVLVKSRNVVFNFKWPAYGQNWIYLFTKSATHFGPM